LGLYKPGLLLLFTIIGIYGIMTGQDWVKAHFSVSFCVACSALLINIVFVIKPTISCCVARTFPFLTCASGYCSTQF
jgi:hypothetical protein